MRTSQAGFGRTSVSSHPLRSYWLLNLAALSWLVVSWRRSGAGLLVAFSAMSLGMVLGYLLLVPVHEALHALAYRVVGAHGVRVRYAWRRLTAQCVADHAVVGDAKFL